MSATPSYAGPCGSQPCQKLPPGDGGGGGGSICVTQRCYRCGVPNPNGYASCDGGTESGACSCNYSGGVCQEYGQCTYVP